jgi:hypothetical protein
MGPSRTDHDDAADDGALERMICCNLLGFIGVSLRPGSLEAPRTRVPQVPIWVVRPDARGRAARLVNQNLE